MRLATDLDGTLLLPPDADYASTALTKNIAYNVVRPAAIAVVANAMDVQKAVRWARDNEIPAVAQSGGHSYAGYSTTEGLIVDMSSLSSIEIDDGSGQVTCGAGVLLGDLDDAVASHNITVPAGRCPTVGLSGLVLGGGFGFSARQMGLTSDNMIETQLVTAQGDLVVCNESENADLFWACRGGGGGNFGINVGFVMAGHEVGDVSWFELNWTGYDEAAAVWAEMQRAAIGAPERDFAMELGIFVDDGGTGGPATNRTLSAWGQYFGPVDELEDILAPLLAAAPPSSQSIEYTTFADATAQLKADAKPDAFLSKSNYLTDPIPDVGIAELIEQMQRFPPEAREGEFKIFTWGGAIRDTPFDATAFVHRTDMFVNEGSGSWHPDDSEDVETATKAWIEETYERMGPYMAERSYQNFIDPTLKDWETGYYGENYERLVEIKSRHDPDDFFSFPQSIRLP
jgi:FAD/FMN-containing dehydrogenase